VPLRVLVAMDAAAQWTGDLWQLSPSVFARCTASGKSAIAPVGAFFRCPECGHDLLDEKAGVFVCQSCARGWRFQGGIYDFREPV